MELNPADGKRLRELRQSAGLSQAQLGQRLHRSREAIARAEGGRLGAATIAQIVRETFVALGQGHLHRCRECGTLLSTEGRPLGTVELRLVRMLAPPPAEITSQSLRAHRREKGWTLRQLAQESGVSLDAVFDVEHQQSRARPSTLRKLATALGVPVAAIAEASPESFRRHAP